MKNKRYGLPHLNLPGSFVFATVLAVSSFPSYSFELLTEGAMDSVSAVSGPIVAESALKSAASKSESLLARRTKLTAGGYEKLPFDTKNTLQLTDINKTSLNLDFALTIEAETWAQRLKVNTDERFTLDVINNLLFSKPEVVEDIFLKDLSRDVRVVSIPGGRKDGEYQLGKLDQTVNVFSVSPNSISYEVNSHVDLAATINSVAYPESGGSFGNTYLTDITATGRQVVTQR